MGSNTQFLSFKEEEKPKENGEGEEIDNSFVAYNAELCIQTQLSIVNIMDRVFHHQA
jgi:hypothetical protein